jgi:Plasmid pRiA4b ORF-3-like protein
MASNDTFILRAGLDGKMSIYRDIEIEPSQSLYRLAEAIVTAFDFEFDHAFGFYSGLKPATLMRTLPRYELFADMGDASPGVGSVKKTRISQAFAEIGHTMIFLFDYGDDWRFRVSLKAKEKKLAKTRYPRVVATRGDAPVQYPDPDDIDDDDRPSYGINLVTGEKIWFPR